MPYKATININQDEWTEFVKACKSLNTTASQEVRNFIQAFKQGKVYDRKNSQDTKKSIDINDLDYDLIKEKVIVELLLDTSWVELLDLENIKLHQTDKQKQKTDIKTDTETDTETDLARKTKGKIKTIETDTETDMKTDNLKKVGMQSKKTKDIKISDTNAELENRENLPSDQLEDWARETFLDREVAEIEGVSKSAIVRRRNGSRKSKNSDFWERWEVSTLNPNRWWKKHNAEFPQGGKNH